MKMYFIMFKVNYRKTNYTCLQCGLNAWAKPDVHLICGECQLRLMSAAEQEV